MKKFMLKAFIWMCYIVTSPMLVLFTIGVLVWEHVEWFLDLGKFMPIEFSADTMAAVMEGIREGHKENMARIDALCEEG